MNTKSNLCFASLLIFLMFSISCSKDSNKQSEKSNLFYGPYSTLGNGQVRTWFRITNENTPEEIGIEFSSGAFENLPSAAEGLALVLPFDQKAQELTRFNHVYLNWNPYGHEPDGVFTFPHFDIHFEMISVEERESIPAWSPGDIDVLFNTYPPPGYMPADYFAPPGPATSEIAMGKHWLPVNLEEYLPFSKIMIYGTYNGKFIFLEPMITLENLKSDATFNLPYSQPEKFSQASFYPTSYNSYFNSDNGNRIVSLGVFVHRNAD